MSTFTAINLDKDELDFEEHTRELQIEMCLKLYDKALRLQKEKKLKESAAIYDQLFKIDVIKNDTTFRGSTNVNNNSSTGANGNNNQNSGVLNPTIENLKYLIYRNRGFLRMNQLIEKIQRKKAHYSTSDDQSKEDDTEENVIEISSSQSSEDMPHPKQQEFDLLISAIQDLITCLQHGEGDYKTIQVLFKFFNFYNFRKLSRFTLEYELICNNEKDLPESVTSEQEPAYALRTDDQQKLETPKHILLPNEITVLLQYYKTLVSIKDDVALQKSLLKSQYNFYKSIYQSTNHLSDSQLNDHVDLNDILTVKEFEEIVNTEREDEEESKHFEIQIGYSEEEINTSEQSSDKVIAKKMKWSDLLEELNNILPKHQKKTRIYDSYILSEVPIEKLTFTLNKLDNIEESNTSAKESVPEETLPSKDKDDVDQQLEEQNKIKEKEKEKDREESSDSDTIKSGVVPRRTLRNSTARTDSSIQSAPSLDLLFFQENMKFQSSLVNFVKLCLPAKNWDSQEKLMASVFQTLLDISNNTDSDSDNVKRANTRSFSQITIISQFVKSLNNWKRSNSESLLIDIQNEDINSANSVVSVREILYSSDLDQQPLTTFSSDSVDDSRDSITILDSLITELSHKNYHFTEIRMKVLESLFGSTSSPLFITYKLDRQSLTNVIKILDACDVSLFKKYNEIYLNSNHKQTSIDKALFTSITILEQLVNEFIGMRQERKLKLKTKLASKSGNSNGSNGNSSANLASNVDVLMGGNTLGNSAQMNEMIISEDIIMRRIDRWMDLVNNFLQETQYIESSDKTSIHFEDYNIVLARFYWSQISFNQHKSNFDSNFIFRKLKTLSELFESNKMKLNLPLINLDHIPSLSVNNVNIQLLKIKIYAKFSDNISNSNSTTSNTNILEKLLLPQSDKSIRKARSKNSRLQINEEESEMDEFIHKSSFELKLRLWQILLNQYSVENSYKQYRVGFEIVLKLLYEASLDCFSETDDEVDEDENGMNKRSEQRNLKFFRLIGFYGSFVENYLKLLQLNKWNISFIEFNNKTSSDEVMSHILYFFNIFYTFLSHEDIAASEFSSLRSFSKISPKSFAKFKQLTLTTTTLLSIYYEKTLDSPSPDLVNDFISILHEQLGLRNCCDQNNGIFLDFIQYRLVDLNWGEADKDFFQCIYCKYGIQVSVGNFTPFDHGCKHVDSKTGSAVMSTMSNGPSSTEATQSGSVSTSTNVISQKDALLISKFVLPYIFKTRNPINNIPKADMKALIDSIHDAIGDITYINNEVIARNTALLESYLTSNHLSLRTIKFAFYGLLHLDGEFEKPGLDISEVAEAGLFYLQGLTALTLYKTRKKNIQGRMVELDYILKMLTTDLMLGSNRYETWVLLAQTFSLLVEDDIIWTSDKLTNEDKKINTALIQRKALLTYLMGVNIYAKMDNEVKHTHSSISFQLWTNFGKELYSALLEPMSKLAFSVSFQPEASKNLGKLIINEKISEISAYRQQQLTLDTSVPLSLNPLTSPAYVNESKASKDKVLHNILRVCFQMAISINPNDWLNYYYLAKAELKLHSSPLLVIYPILESCSLALKSSSKEDPIIEPHYKLCSALFKLVKSKSLSTSDALDSLKKNPLFKSIDQDSDLSAKCCENETQFYEYIVLALKKVCAYDKKNWHHKPHYRIAKIYFEEFHNTEKAKKEMSSIINLKLTVRNLSTIWKPDSERPGKHFVYNYEYIVFYIELLSSSHDIHQLFIVTRKLRRFGSSMIHLLRAWEYAVSISCTMMKQISGIYENFLDKEILKLIYPKFVEYSDQFLTYLESRKEFTNEEKLDFYFMSEASELRRMANGFGMTSAIDECYHSLFLKIFLNYCENILGDRHIAGKRVGMEQSPQPNGTVDSPQQQLTFVVLNSKTISTPVPAPKHATPSREKWKVARRDITPYCVKALKIASKVLEEIAKDAAEGILLPYEFSEQTAKTPDPKQATMTDIQAEKDEESPLKDKSKDIVDNKPLPSLPDMPVGRLEGGSELSLKEKIQEIFNFDDDIESDRAASLQPVETVPRTESITVVNNEDKMDVDKDKMDIDIVCDGELNEITPAPLDTQIAGESVDTKESTPLPESLEISDEEDTSTDQNVMPLSNRDQNLEKIEEDEKENEVSEKNEDQPALQEDIDQSKNEDDNDDDNDIEEVDIDGNKILDSEINDSSKVDRKKITPDTPKRQTQSKITSFFEPSPKTSTLSSSNTQPVNESPLRNEVTNSEKNLEEAEAEAGTEHNIFPPEDLISPPIFTKKRPITYGRRAVRQSLRSKRQKTNDLIVVEDDDQPIEGEEEKKHQKEPEGKEVEEAKVIEEAEKSRVSEEVATVSITDAAEVIDSDASGEDVDSHEDFVDAIESLSQDPKGSNDVTPEPVKPAAKIEIIDLDDEVPEPEEVPEVPTRRPTRRSTRNKSSV